MLPPTVARDGEVDVEGSRSMNRWPLARIGLTVPIAACMAVVVPSSALGFGTYWALGQRTEHQLVTRGALGCYPASQAVSNSCFQSRSLDQLAGSGHPTRCAPRGLGRFGNPDLYQVIGSEQAHCDDAGPVLAA